MEVFVRDSQLSDYIINLYQTGLIIREPGYSNCTSLIGGLQGNIRFTILSDHMNDYSAYQQGSQWQIHAGLPNSHFKVLDVYHHNGKTQVLLYHLADNRTWRYQQVEPVNTVQYQKQFERWCNEDAIPELDQQWLARCEDPLGVDEDGVLFNAEPDLLEEMNEVYQLGFRDLYHRYLYVEHFSSDPEMDGALLYGYVKEGQLVFAGLTKASIIDNKLICEPCERFTYTYQQIQNDFCLNLDSVDIDLSQYPFDSEESEGEVTLRNFTFLDHCRNIAYPDLIVDILCKGEMMEQVWVQVMDALEDTLVGRLLSETKQDFGLHPGDQVYFKLMEDENENIICVTDLN